MTLRYQSWPLDLIMALSLVSVVVSVWLVWETRRTTQHAHTKHLVGVEAEFVTLPLAGAVFRLAQQLAFGAFALVLWTVPRPGMYPLIALYVLGQGTMPLHSFLLLRRQQRALRRIPPASGAAYPPRQNI